jgi:hypothetical protein
MWPVKKVTSSPSPRFVAASHTLPKWARRPGDRIGLPVVPEQEEPHHPEADLETSAKSSHLPASKRDQKDIAFRRGQ